MALDVVEFLLSGFTNNSGEPLNGGKVYTYEAGTSTAKAVYTDSAGATPETNPVVLDSNGRKQVFAKGTYKFVVKTSADVTLYTFDNLSFADHATTLAEIAVLNSAGSEITIKSAITLTGNLTLTAPVKILKGGSFTTSGYTLTLNGALTAGAYQIFTAAKNEVILGADSCVEAYPEWWGAAGDGVTNDCDAFRCAIGAHLNIKLRNSTYLIEGTASSGDQMLYLGVSDGTSSRNGMTISGVGNNSVVKLGSSVGNAKLLFGGGTLDSLYNMTFRDFKIDLNGSNNLQSAFGDPLRYNMAFYFYSYCENFLFENLYIQNASGSQVLRIGKDTSGGVGKNIRVINCVFDTFGIGLTGNNIQDCSVLYLEAQNVIVEDCIFRNADFTFSLSRGHTAIELHGKRDSKIINNNFEYTQNPLLLSSPYTGGAVDTVVKGNTFYQCNYLMTFDASATSNEQSRVDILGNVFTSTKSNSVIIPIGSSSEGARTRAQINFKDNIMNGSGNTNQRTHIFRVENTYLNSLNIENNDIMAFKGCLIYLAGPALPDVLGNIRIANNRLDSLGPDGAGDFPTVPVMILVDPTSNTLHSLVITGNTFINSESKDYSGLGVIRRADNITYLYIGGNHFHLLPTYPVVSGTLGTFTLRYEEFWGSKTWDPGSVNDAAQTSTTVTVTGAVVGDVALAGFTTVVPAGMLLTAAVTATNTVTVTLTNHSGAPVDLASGTLRARVMGY